MALFCSAMNFGIVTASPVKGSLGKIFWISKLLNFFEIFFLEAQRHQWSGPFESFYDFRLLWKSDLLKNQQSWEMIQRMESGLTPVSSSWSRASIPVFPAPITTYLKLSLITPLSAQISASNFHDLTQITSSWFWSPRVECALTQSAQKNRALWVKAHSARGGRGVNRKHHPAERCDLRFGFQSAQKIFLCASSQISNNYYI